MPGARPRRQHGRMSRLSSRRAGRPDKERHELKDVGYEIFVGAVSVLSILNLVLMYVVEDESLDTVLLVMNVVLTVILFIDFVYRLVTAPSRVGLLLPPVRLGRPAGQPALARAEDPARLPPGAGRPRCCARTASGSSATG